MKYQFNQRPLFIFEMANNHMGDVEHGIKIVKELSKIVNLSTFASAREFDFAIKMQYRHLDTFIHPDYKERKDIKYIKRFQETRLSEQEFLRIKDEIGMAGFLSICTAFDETSVDLIVKHDYHLIKVASCSLTDWPLLEKIASTSVDKSVILSTAGALEEDIDNVTNFFKNRKREIALLHCVGEYPTQRANLQLNQLDFFKNKYPQMAIGFSTHEEPSNLDSIKIAVSKGATIFEKHVGVKTEKYPLNDYSSTPEQIAKWLESAADTFRMCGVRNQRRGISAKEQADLDGLKRGIFASRAIAPGEQIDLNNTFFAIPNCAGDSANGSDGGSDGGKKQLLANHFSKYSQFIVEDPQGIAPLQPILFSQVRTTNLQQKVVEIMGRVKKLLHQARVPLSDKTEVELSHHYGPDSFYEYGATIINCINREYCKKIIVLLPNQKHPLHYHSKKEEAFHILYGKLMVDLAGVQKEYKTGDMIVIEREAPHSFQSSEGAIVEEISTTHFAEDSFYQDELITKNRGRKTKLYFYSNWYEQ